MTIFCQGPLPEYKLPSFKTPVGMTDSHFHIFGPASKFEYVEKREYTPPDALPETYNKLCEAIGIERAVLIQPSAYGEDNSCMVEAVKHIKVPTRMVIVVPPSISDAELEQYHKAGARGIRFILAHEGGIAIDQLEKVSQRIKEFGWHVQLLLRSNHLLELGDRLKKMKTNFVIDHLAFIPPSRGTEQPAFKLLLELLETGNCWVKLTAGYRYSNELAPYSDITPFAKILTKTFSERLLWGSDWPHAVFHGTMPNTTDLLNLLCEWVPEEKKRNKILADNPTMLFDF